MRYISTKSGLLTLLSLWLIYPAIWGLNWACAPSEGGHTGPMPLAASLAIRCAVLVEHFVPSIVGTVLLVVIA